MKELVHAFSCAYIELRMHWEVWRALKKLEFLSAAPRATLTLLSCSPNFPHASITRYTHAKHESILKWPSPSMRCAAGIFHGSSIHHPGLDICFDEYNLAL